MFAEKFQTFMSWWYSVFATWDPDRLPSWLFWFLQDSQMANVPQVVADVMLVIIVCSLISPIILLLPLAKGKGSPIALKLWTIPVAFLGLIGLFLGNSLFETFMKGTLPNTVALFTEDIPVSWQELQTQFAAAKACSEGFFFYLIDGPELMESLFVFLVNALFGPILLLISYLLHGGGALLCFSPFIGLFIANIWLYKLTGPIHFLADVGCAMLLLLGVALAIFATSFIMGFVMIFVYFLGFVMLRPIWKIVTIRIDYDPYS